MPVTTILLLTIMLPKTDCNSAVYIMVTQFLCYPVFYSGASFMCVPKRVKILLILVYYVYRKF